ncbi:Ig-like domain-containing protein [Shewanella rhizosphaerae]|uniref:Ig-like domain-containing protein n=1 Tax=Shewanella rhizosphaerae TaxID=2864207 RepID=UPI001C661068|nr:Ig-like domain-containing protein [Shewanella rhizosphaerae]QYK11422.1 Ig-like domain-containing protein [Shewanella rhizosphaerae]
MKSAFKVFTSYLFLLFIVACSGGGNVTDGGSGGTPTPPTISIALSIDNTQISVAEPAMITAKVKDSTGAAVSTLVSFSLNNDTYGTFSPGTGEVATDADGIAKVRLDTAAINTGATIIATTSSGESASLNVTMVGDGGEAGGGAQVSVSLTDSTGNPIQSISILEPGKITATVTGITKPTIVTFATTIGDLPIKTAVTDSEGKATVDIYAGSSLGAGEVTASLSTNEVGKTIVVVGATNVVMGSGDPFVQGKAEISTATLSAGGTATISVLIQDDKGNPFTQPVDVNFSSTCATKNPAQAEISSPVSSSNGVATSTYRAQGCVGEDQINVTANAGGISLSSTGTLTVLQADVGSIVFESATPQNIAILGTGGIESSVVKFKVLDKNSNPVPNQNVLFSLNTKVGGVDISPLQATTNNEGIVQTVVTTGTVATSLRVTATVDNGAVPAISSQSSQLIVSTGIPDQDSFSLSASVLNAEGWDEDGTKVVVTARMADAFNNPVPDGTTVSFTTEGGSIEDACQTVNGACSVTWTSQLPRPEGETIISGAGEMIRNPSAALIYYSTLGVYGNVYGQKYGGRATVTATAIGEESFPDLNGNGRFDASEMAEFTNGKDVTGQSFDLTDAYNDYNEDGLFNPQQSGGQIGGTLEELIDFNANGVFEAKDGKYNGVLCSDPVHAGCADGVNDSKSLYVRRSLVIVMSGSTAYGTAPDDILISDKDGDHYGGSISIVGKGAANVSFTISDLHNQQMPAGSKVRFKTSAGSVVSSAEYVWPSSNYNGGREFTVTLKGEDEPNTGVFIVEVETPGGLTTQVVSIGVSIL